MKTDRHVYLKMKTLEEARRILFERFPSFDGLSVETVSVTASVGRVLAEPVFAAASSPNCHSSAMDGIAVKAESTYGAFEGSPKELVIGKDAFYVNTGHVIPSGTDAVIMIEHVNKIGEDRVEIEKSAYPWQHVRKMGEDIVATELLFPRNHEVTPYCVGALIAGGVFEVPVRKRPKVLIIPTGSELVDWREVGLKGIKPGQVPESNAFVLGALVEACGGIYEKAERQVDDFEKITNEVLRVADENFDAVLVIGGSSAGSEDYSKDVIKELGEVLIHGVTIMPGKPVVFGVVKNKPAFGIPGYPVSAIIAFEQFVKPLICMMLGKSDEKRATAPVSPVRKMPSKLGVEEFLRVKLGKVGGRIVAAPLPRGAGSITSITEADGIIRVPNHVEGLKEHESVTAELLRPLSAVENTIVAVGSHDITLDILADRLRAQNSGLTLSSSHVGSLGGLTAIKKGVCHIAGSHLLDETDGTYNASWIRRIIPGIPVKLVHLVLRDQGLIVAPGNPRGIGGIEDLGRSGVTFINRQSGSGTRILLDFRLKKLGIDPTSIDGYENDEYTHMSVAAAVKSGTADAGLGIYAAAKALELDFVPVVTEQYDLVIPDEYFETEKIMILLEAVRSAEFKEQVESLGGYGTEKTGEIVATLNK